MPCTLYFVIQDLTLLTNLLRESALETIFEKYELNGFACNDMGTKFAKCAKINYGLVRTLGNSTRQY